MNINKILYVPSDRIVGFQSNAYTYTIKKMIKGLFNKNIFSYDAEILFCGDLPLVLGNNNVFSFGKYQPQYFHDKIPKFCPYPSCCKTPEPIFINKNELTSFINEVDVLLVSSRAGERGKYAITKAKNRDLPVAILDIQDHESIYGSNDIENELVRGFSYKNHYDLYFKKDLPLGYKTEIIIPLAPTTVRPESFSVFKFKKEYDIYYSGRKRVEKCQPDRLESVNLIRENFSHSLIYEHESRDTFISTRENWANISKSIITLSPSGRVWDSFRHCEIGLTGATIPLLPKPYIETIEPYLKDGENVILYETKLQNGRYHLANKKELIDKVKYFLDNTSICEKMASTWNQDVLSGHTILERSKYIINVLGKTF